VKDKVQRAEILHRLNAQYGKETLPVISTLNFLRAIKKTVSWQDQVNSEEKTWEERRSSYCITTLAHN
jgi:hypothetical protein